MQHYHAAATHGNAPGFDILVCNETGEKSVAIQVKSAQWAKKTIKGKASLDFPLGYKAGKVNRDSVYFAFVDFGVAQNQKPDIYLIRSTWLHHFCESWIDQYIGKMVRFQPEVDWIKEFKIEDGNWSRLREAGVLPSTNESSMAELETPQ